MVLIWRVVLVKLLFSWQVVSSSLWPHGRQHPRPLCPSPSPRLCPSLCPLNQWCHPTVILCCCPLLLCPSILPGIRVFSNESVLVKFTHLNWRLLSKETGLPNVCGPHPITWRPEYEKKTAPLPPSAGCFPMPSAPSAGPPGPPCTIQNHMSQFLTINFSIHRHTILTLLLWTPWVLPSPWIQQILQPALLPLVDKRSNS